MTWLHLYQHFAIFAWSNCVQTMKGKVVIAFLSSLLLLFSIGCKEDGKALSKMESPHHFAELKEVSDHMETDPEVAFGRLMQWTDSLVSWSVSDRYEWQLFCVEALFKTHRLTDDCPDLSPVVAFYDSLSLLYPKDKVLCDLQAHAYYYKGVTLSARKEDAEAVRCYLSALRSMERVENDTPARNRFAALTYTRLGELLYHYGIHSMAKEAFADAAEGFALVNDSLALASVIRNEAAIFQAEKNYGSAMARFQEAEHLAPSEHDFLCHAQGCMLYDMQQYDSAAPYLERSFEDGDRFVRTDAAARLADIYRKNGQLDREVYFTRYYVACALKESSMASVKMEIEFVCGNQLKVDTIASQDGEKSRLLLIVLFAVLACGTLVMVIARNRRRIHHIERQINTMEESHRQERAGKDREIAHIAQQLSDTRELLENMYRPSFETSWHRFCESAIVEKIRGSVDGKDIMIKNVGMFPQLKLSEKDFIELFRELNADFEGFSLRLTKEFPELTTGDLRHCALAMLGLNHAEIAVLQGMSYSGSNRRANKILSVLHAKDSLEVTLLSYLENNW